MKGLSDKFCRNDGNPAYWTAFFTKGKKMKKIILSVCIIACILSQGFTFEGPSELDVKMTDLKNPSKISLFSAENDSGDDGFHWLHENDGKKHWLTGVSGGMIFNLGLATWNRYMIGSAWAKTGWNEWGHFWEREMSWDDDWYWTNFVLHPYQGALYYNAARGSNLNQGEAFIITMLNAAFWEWFCETNAPSKNDMIYTTVGAFSMGEMLYRLSLEADEVSSLLGFAVSPMRLLTQGFTRQKPMGTTGNISELSYYFGINNSIAYTALSDVKDYESREIYPVYGNAGMSVVYGNPFGHDSNIPYSQFELDLGFGAGMGSGQYGPCAFEDLDKKMFYDIQLFSSGMLLSRAPLLADNKETTIGLVMEYDFDWHSFFMISSLAPGFAIKQRINYEDSRIEWQAHLAAILCGTTENYYVRRIVPYEYLGQSKRLYSYATGAETVLKFKYATDKGYKLDLDGHGYAMYSFEDQEQPGRNLGWELAGLVRASYEIPLAKTVRLGINDKVYLKKTLFTDTKYHDNYWQILNTAGMFFKLQVK